MRAFNHRSAQFHLAGFIVIGCVIAFLGMGCGNPAPGPANPAKVSGTVGIADLDAVMDGIGWKPDLDRERAATAVGGNQAFAAFQDAVIKELKAKLAALGKAAHLTTAQLATVDSLDVNAMQKLPFTTDQKNEINVYMREAQDQLNTVGQQIKKAVNDREVQIISLYRATIKPAVRHVAQTKGYSLVILHSPSQDSDNIFFSDSAIDLTNDVVDDLRKTQSKPSLPEPLRYTLPPPQFNLIGSAPTTSPASKDKDKVK